jgi:hypothetical protein
MTRISTIHGIPFNEYADRSANVAAKDYFPYLSMTKGEMELALLRQRAQMYAGFYPEYPVYRQAVAMLDKALKDGDTGVNYIGAVPDDLQGLAATIQTAAKKRQPASRAGFQPSAKVGSIIPVQQRYDECYKAEIERLRAQDPFGYATPAGRQKQENFAKAKCGQAFTIETILNNGIEKCGHHLLYKSLPRNYAVPQDVSTKRILHGTGVEGMALVGDIDTDLMYLWVENGILLKNTEQKIGPLNSTYTSMYLAPDPEQALNQYKAWLQGQPVGKQAKIKAGGIGKIGIDPITAGVIIAIVGALTAAFDMLKEMRKQKAYAMVQAQGFGTQAFSANQGDWMGAPSANNDNLLLIGGAAAALYLLSDN